MTSLGDLTARRAKIAAAVDAFFDKGGKQSWTHDGVTITLGNVGEWMQMLDRLDRRIEALGGGMGSGDPINYGVPGDRS